MRPKNEGNHGFTCIACGEVVLPAATTARNHCPHCLVSLHVDGTVPGDRAAQCSGAMPAIAAYQKNGEWYITHRCTQCGFQRNARLLADDSLTPVYALTQLV